MRINLTRVLAATAALLILGLVVIVVIQYRRIEHFMIKEYEKDLSGTTMRSLSNLSAERCDSECTNDPSCKAAVMKSDGSCLLKSTIGVPVSDIYSTSLVFPCELYEDIEFGGKGVTIDVGMYTLTDLQNRGYTDKSLSSFKLRDGYKITLYEKNGFGGNSVSFKTSQPDLGVVVRDPRTEPTIKWTNAVSSIVLEKAL
jgi:hypothetical protein